MSISGKTIKGKLGSAEIKGRAYQAEIMEGRSAYEVAVRNGFEGSESQWLASLKGEQGDRGATGAKITSTVLIGQSADGGNIYLQSFDDGSSASFTAPKGAKGDKGDKGNTGDVGATGAKGDKGDKGDKGEKGDKGDTYTLTDADKEEIANGMLPIGYIFITTSNIFTPSLMFGGTWERIEGKFLLGASNSYMAGRSGGSADAIVPNHTHELRGKDGNPVYSGTSGSLGGIILTSPGYANQGNAGYQLKTGAATNGESVTGKNMPPYLSVYMWERVA